MPRISGKLAATRGNYLAASYWFTCLASLLASCKPALAELFLHKAICRQTYLKQYACYCNKKYVQTLAYIHIEMSVKMATLRAKQLPGELTLTCPDLPICNGRSNIKRREKSSLQQIDPAVTQNRGSDFQNVT
jgi:hypothetical protein